MRTSLVALGLIEALAPVGEPGPTQKTATAAGTAAEETAAGAE